MAGKRKYIFGQKCFYLQGILDDINEQDSSFVDCKHKHIMKSGAPPDKFGVLYICSPIEFHLARASSNWKQLFIDVVRALERYSKDPGSSPGGDTCFSHQ